MKKYKITFFENKTQSIQERYFNTHDDALEWAKKNLEKNIEESITKINYTKHYGRLFNSI